MIHVFSARWTATRLCEALRCLHDAILLCILRADSMLLQSCGLDQHDCKHSALCMFQQALRMQASLDGLVGSPALKKVAYACRPKQTQVMFSNSAFARSSGGLFPCQEGACTGCSRSRSIHEGRFGPSPEFFMISGRIPYSCYFVDLHSKIVC